MMQVFFRSRSAAPLVGCAVALLAVSLTGCRTLAGVVGSPDGELQAGATWVTEPPFLEPPADGRRTVYVRFINRTAEEDVDLKAKFAVGAKKQGWQMVPNEDDATMSVVIKLVSLQMRKGVAQDQAWVEATGDMKEAVESESEEGLSANQNRALKHGMNVFGKAKEWEMKIEMALQYPRGSARGHDLRLVVEARQIALKKHEAVPAMGDRFAFAIQSLLP